MICDYWRFLLHAFQVTESDPYWEDISFEVDLQNKPCLWYPHCNKCVAQLIQAITAWRRPLFHPTLWREKVLEVPAAMAVKPFQVTTSGHRPCLKIYSSCEVPRLRVYYPRSKFLTNCSRYSALIELYQYVGRFDIYTPKVPTTDRNPFFDTILDVRLMTLDASRVNTRLHPSIWRGFCSFVEIKHTPHDTSWRQPCNTLLEHNPFTNTDVRGLRVQLPLRKWLTAFRTYTQAKLLQSKLESW